MFFSRTRLAETCLVCNASIGQLHLSSNKQKNTVSYKSLLSFTFSHKKSHTHTDLSGSSFHLTHPQTHKHKIEPISRFTHWQSHSVFFPSHKHSETPILTHIFLHNLIHSYISLSLHTLNLFLFVIHLQKAFSTSNFILT